jgi:hypothetical protein
MSAARRPRPRVADAPAASASAPRRAPAARGTPPPGATPGRRERRTLRLVPDTDEHSGSGGAEGLVARSAAPPRPAPIGDPALAPVMEAMLAELDPDALAEIQRALRLTLAEPQSPSQRHAQELGALALILRSHGVRPPALPERVTETRGILRRTDGSGRGGALSPDELWPTVTPARYDELRPPDAPSAKSLTRRFEGWLYACRAAGAITIDGQRLSSGTAWHQDQRGGPGARSRPPYTRDECLAAIDACAIAHERSVADGLPCTSYIAWARAQRAWSRKHGLPDPRIPDYHTVRKHFRHGRWPEAIRAWGRWRTS